MMQGTALQTSPHAPLQGAATWQIKGHVSRATACHLESLMMTAELLP